jgi:L-aspartate oxidase
MYRDAPHLGTARFRKRFPGIKRLCDQFESDVGRHLLPVRPAAHYMVGGVVVDIETRTPLAGLLACGEAASSGVHGANRLASNSLLEGLVFGAVAGRVAGESLDGPAPFPPALLHSDIPESPRTMLDLSDIRNSLRSLMWRNVGIERSGPRLAETEDIISFWDRYVMDKLFDDRQGWELQNMLTVARLITAAASAREESRGVHYRLDFPEASPSLDGRRLVLHRGPDGLRIHVPQA